ncbi:sugar-transfer associated ATP-grasp domain-containing protein [Arhodomonas sp. SL1]|uniref:sugar-transfer associated ATP-grasp domain-containing protein n=1 Tax=Arhodomonas sp. SL1 TaxID=3425691 RepID=UPI003F880BE4
MFSVTPRVSALTALALTAPGRPRAIGRAYKLWRDLRRIRGAASHYGTSLVWTLARARRAHDMLFSVEDMMFYGLLDPAIADSDLELYVSREARVRIEHRLNNPAVREIAHDKDRFHAHCRAHGLPVPRTMGVFEAPPPGEAEAQRRDWLARLADTRPRDLFCKRVDGIRGEGSWILEGTAADGAPLSSQTLYDRLLSNAGNARWLVQARERAHSEIARATGSKALQGARLVTFIDASDDPHIIFSRFKFIVGDNLVDNFAWGATGNLVADVDLASGRVKTVFSKTPGEIGMQHMTHHPTTGASLPGLTIPHWREACELARAAALSLPDLRVLAWDIAIANDGPLLLEANSDWIISPPGPMRAPIEATAWRALIRPLV